MKKTYDYQTIFNIWNTLLCQNSIHEYLKSTRSRFQFQPFKTDLSENEYSIKYASNLIHCSIIHVNNVNIFRWCLSIFLIFIWLFVDNSLVDQNFSYTENTNSTDCTGLTSNFEAVLVEFPFYGRFSCSLWVTYYAITMIYVFSLTCNW